MICPYSKQDCAYYKGRYWPPAHGGHAHHSCGGHLRDQAAIAYMQAVVSRGMGANPTEWRANLGRDAYAMADALLAARDKDVAP